jgi:hypothetical protein
MKQSDLDEYEENPREKRKIQIYKIKHQFPLKPSNKDAKHQFSNSRGQQPKLKVSQCQKIILLLKPGKIKPSSKLNQRRQLPTKKQNKKYKGLVKNDRCADLEVHVTYDLLRWMCLLNMRGSSLLEKDLPSTCDATTPAMEEVVA